MGYVEQNLNPGERILYTTHLHWIVLFRSIFVDALSFLPAVPRRSLPENYDRLSAKLL